MYDDIKAMATGAQSSELIGFALDQSNIENEIAAVSAVKDQYANGLQCGTYEDVDATLAQMLKEMRQAACYDTDHRRG